MKKSSELMNVSLRAAAVLAVAVMATRQGHAEDLVIPIGRGLEESVDLRGGRLVAW